VSEIGAATIDAKPAERRGYEATALAVLVSISFGHLLNDMMQALLPALYPVLKDSLGLEFGEIGLVTFVYQMTASILQPAVGFYADKRPRTYALAAGMGFTLTGLLLLSRASGLSVLLLSAALIGMGSSIFHPEASRVARMASGGRHGFAQSLFQVGGNFGSAIGPLLAAFVVLPRGQHSVAWFSVAALLGMAILAWVGNWYRDHLAARAKARRPVAEAANGLSRKQVGWSLGILMVLIFSKYFYLASITSYFTFYLIDRFHVSVQQAQIQLFIFSGAVAAGTILGGPIGDKIGRKRVIWVSILGVLPFTLLMPHVGLFWTGVLSAIIGIVLASAFSAILVFAQELVPGRVGTIAGLFFGFAFGMGGIGAAVLGKLADLTSIEFVYQICAFLPALGLLTAFLPNLRQSRVSR